MDYATLKKQINIEEAFIASKKYKYRFHFDKPIVGNINFLEILMFIATVSFIYLNIYVGIYFSPIINNLQFSLEVNILIFTIIFIANCFCFFYVLSKLYDSQTSRLFEKGNKTKFFTDNYSHLPELFSNQQEMAPIINELSQYNHKYHLNSRFISFYNAYYYFIYFITDTNYEQAFWELIKMIKYEKDIEPKHRPFEKIEDEYININNKIIFTQHLNEHLDNKIEPTYSKKAKI